GFTLHDIEHDGVRLRARRSGAGPPLLLLHGHPQTHAMWHAVAGPTREALSTRLLPQIRKVFQFKVGHIERYMVACYDAQDGGYFRPHRDDTTPGTAHRRFACSINLNAEDFEGGDLTFAEFGPKTYRPPTGGAVVFSCSLLHEATPVTRGKRYAFLPFFYDAEAAAIRAANRGTFETAEEA
ncbi:MAG: 2OG-Fe(II) oxygenase, partial [Pseudomonadota bacterium]